jgi:hypothetical protein
MFHENFLKNKNGEESVLLPRQLDPPVAPTPRERRVGVTRD